MKSAMTLMPLSIVLSGILLLCQNPIFVLDKITKKIISTISKKTICGTMAAVATSLNTLKTEDSICLFSVGNGGSC